MKMDSSPSAVGTGQSNDGPDHRDPQPGENLQNLQNHQLPSNSTDPKPPRRRRKLRVLVVTLGGERQKQIEQMFYDDPRLSENFEPPTFSPGVTSRQLRSRYSFFEAAARAGLLPEQEWTMIQKAYSDVVGPDPTKTKKERHAIDLATWLKDVPITTDGRRGSPADLELHYSEEFWRKAKTLNRGRAVLACVFAHLIAMKTFVESDERNGANGDTSGGFDAILEDNVRVSPEQCADQIWESIHAVQEWEQLSGEKCHLRLVGWLSSITNLKWIFNMHIPKRQYDRRQPSHNSSNDGKIARNNGRVDGNGESHDDSLNSASIFPFPRAEFLEEDLKEMYGDDDPVTTDGDNALLDGIRNNDKESGGVDTSEDVVDEKDQAPKTHSRPGGNPIWGNYGYWISSAGYHKLMDTLRRDVGAMLWRGRRMKIYTVKPIDKIVPRQMLSLMGPEAVQISTRPAFFRAPMLTSKIHTQWDPEFCKSTQYQLEASRMDWNDLWLTDTEKEVVDHHSSTGAWLTPAQLEELRRNK
mmetsp:Transcript_19295/g.46602  ORF Transcript_19295/g.46602 Transcript_19295/m.46602 type:complete len:526 (+) Transcript_19295:184-1761(+)